MVGSFATSKAGHDKQKLYVVLAEAGDFVYLCDGRIKPLAHPKKKKKRHIQIVNCKVNESLLEKLNAIRDIQEIGNSNIFDEEIKYEIKQYSKHF